MVKRDKGLDLGFDAKTITNRIKKICDEGEHRRRLEDKS